MNKKNLALLGVPVDCTGNAGGCDRATWAFRKLGVRNAIGAKHDFNDLPVRIGNKLRDPASGVVGAADVVDVNRATHQGVADMLQGGLTPVLLGGCCSYVMGAVAAAREVIGDIALVYVDGHMDLYDGKTSPGGECADMPLAFILGKGPAILDGVLEKPFPASRIFLLGYRDGYLAEPLGSLLPEHFEPHLHHSNADELRETGLITTSHNILERLGLAGTKFWLHLDWDVLDENVLPSADYLMPGGLTVPELVELVKPLAQSPLMIGMSTACYNPDNDVDLRDGKMLVEAMGEIFREDELR
jgi:arginase